MIKPALKYSQHVVTYVSTYHIEYGSLLVLVEACEAGHMGAFTGPVCLISL